MNPEPSRSDRLFGDFHDALETGDTRRCKRLLVAVRQAKASAGRSFALWSWAVFQDDLDAALAAATQGVQQFPEDPDLRHALGWTLLELERPADAIVHLEEACFLDEDHADAWYDLAVAREATGDVAGMRQAFAEVWELDSDDPTPLEVAEDELVRWAEEALDELPDDLRTAVRDVAILVQAYPDRWITEDEPWDPRLLGLFTGATHTDLHATGGVLEPPVVYLFQRNLERAAPDDLPEQVRITVHHEIGHFLGLDEEALHARGLG